MTRRRRARAVAAALLITATVGAIGFAGRARWLPFWRVRTMESRVELLDAGAEPRRTLAYGYTRAPRSFVSIGQSGFLEVRGILQNEESYAPPVVARWVAGEMATRFGVTRIDWRLDEARTLDDAKVTGEARRQFDATLSGLVGLRVVTWIGPRGQLLVDTSAVVEPGRRRIVDSFVNMLSLQMIVPLPGEPVGRGARWAARLDRSIGPAGRVHSRMEYQLDDTDGEDGFDVAVKLEMKGDAQPAPGARESIVVDQIEGSGSGRIVRMRREATPVQSDLVYQVGMSLTPLPAGQREPTDEQRVRGYRVALRTREMMQAADIGAIDWIEDPPEAPDAED